MALTADRLTRPDQPAPSADADGRFGGAHAVMSSFESQVASLGNREVTTATRDALSQIATGPHAADVLRTIEDLAAGENGKTLAFAYMNLATYGVGIPGSSVSGLVLRYPSFDGDRLQLARFRLAAVMDVVAQHLANKGHNLDNPTSRSAEQSAETMREIHQTLIKLAGEQRFEGFESNEVKSEALIKAFRSKFLQDPSRLFDDVYQDGGTMTNVAAAAASQGTVRTASFADSAPREPLVARRVVPGTDVPRTPAAIAEQLRAANGDDGRVLDLITGLEGPRADEDLTDSERYQVAKAYLENPVGSPTEVLSAFRQAMVDETSGILSDRNNRIIANGVLDQDNVDGLLPDAHRLYLHASGTWTRYTGLGSTNGAGVHQILQGLNRGSIKKLDGDLQSQLGTDLNTMINRLDARDRRLAHMLRLAPRNEAGQVPREFFVAFELSELAKDLGWFDGAADRAIDYLRGNADRPEIMRVLNRMTATEAPLVAAIFPQMRNLDDADGLQPFAMPANPGPVAGSEMARFLAREVEQTLGLLGGIGSDADKHARRRLEIALNGLHVEGEISPEDHERIAELRAEYVARTVAMASEERVPTRELMDAIMMVDRRYEEGEVQPRNGFPSGSMVREAYRKLGRDPDQILADAARVAGEAGYEPAIEAALSSDLGALSPDALAGQLHAALHLGDAQFLGASKSRVYQMLNMSWMSADQRETYMGQLQRAYHERFDVHLEHDIGRELGTTVEVNGTQLPSRGVVLARFGRLTPAQNVLYAIHEPTAISIFDRYEPETVAGALAQSRGLGAIAIRFEYARMLGQDYNPKDSQSLMDAHILERYGDDAEVRLAQALSLPSADGVNQTVLEGEAYLVRPEDPEQGAFIEVRHPNDHLEAHFADVDGVVQGPGEGHGLATKAFVRDLVERFGGLRALAEAAAVSPASVGATLNEIRSDLGENAVMSFINRQLGNEGAMLQQHFREMAVLAGRAEAEYEENALAADGIGFVSDATMQAIRERREAITRDLPNYQNLTAERRQVLAGAVQAGALIAASAAQLGPMGMALVGATSRTATHVLTGQYDLAELGRQAALGGTSGYAAGWIGQNLSTYDPVGPFSLINAPEYVGGAAGFGYFAGASHGLVQAATDRTVLNDGGITRAVGEVFGQAHGVGLQAGAAAAVIAAITVALEEALVQEKTVNPDGEPTPPEDPPVEPPEEPPAERPGARPGPGPSDGNDPAIVPGRPSPGDGADPVTDVAGVGRGGGNDPAFGSRGSGAAPATSGSSGADSALAGPRGGLSGRDGAASSDTPSTPPVGARGRSSGLTAGPETARPAMPSRGGDTGGVNLPLVDRPSILSGGPQPPDARAVVSGRGSSTPTDVAPDGAEVGMRSATPADPAAGATRVGSLPISGGSQQLPNPIAARAGAATAAAATATDASSGLARALGTGAAEAGRSSITPSLLLENGSLPPDLHNGINYLLKHAFGRTLPGYTVQHSGFFDTIGLTSSQVVGLGTALLAFDEDSEGAQRWAAMSPEQRRASYVGIASVAANQLLKGLKTGDSIVEDLSALETHTKKTAGDMPPRYAELVAAGADDTARARALLSHIFARTKAAALANLASTAEGSSPQGNGSPATGEVGAPEGTADNAASAVLNPPGNDAASGDFASAVSASDHPALAGWNDDPWLQQNGVKALEALSGMPEGELQARIDAGEDISTAELDELLADYEGTPIFDAERTLRDVWLGVEDSLGAVVRHTDVGVYDDEVVTTDDVDLLEALNARYLPDGSTSATRAETVVSLQRIAEFVNSAATIQGTDVPLEAIEGFNRQLHANPAIMALNNDKPFLETLPDPPTAISDASLDAREAFVAAQRTSGLATTANDSPQDAMKAQVTALREASGAYENALLEGLPAVNEARAALDQLKAMREASNVGADREQLIAQDAYKRHAASLAAALAQANSRQMIAFLRASESRDAEVRRTLLLDGVGKTPGALRAMRLSGRDPLAKDLYARLLAGEPVTLSPEEVKAIQPQPTNRQQSDADGVAQNEANFDRAVRRALLDAANDGAAAPSFGSAGLMLLDTPPAASARVALEAIEAAPSDKRVAMVKSLAQSLRSLNRENALLAAYVLQEITVQAAESEARAEFASKLVFRLLKGGDGVAPISDGKGFSRHFALEPAPGLEAERLGLGFAALSAEAQDALADEVKTIGRGGRGEDSNALKQFRAWGWDG